MILSDQDIAKEITDKHIQISPFKKENIQPASYDVTLYKQLRVLPASGTPIDVIHAVNYDNSQLIDIENSAFELGPGRSFILAATREYLTLPDNIAARIEGRSSLGRLGLIIHSTAGYVDPGWQGRLTLEVTNIGPSPLLLRAGMGIGQLSFVYLNTPAERPYGHKTRISRYQGDKGPEPSRFEQVLPVS